MSYQAAAALQAAIYSALRAAPDLAGVEVGDARLTRTRGPFILLGPEEVRDASDRSGGGAQHRLSISVLSAEEGFAQAKRLAGLVEGIVSNLTGPLGTSGARLSYLRFERASAKRPTSGGGRRIDLTFVARLDYAP